MATDDVSDLHMIANACGPYQFSILEAPLGFVTIDQTGLITV